MRPAPALLLLLGACRPQVHGPRISPVAQRAAEAGQPLDLIVRISRPQGSPRDLPAWRQAISARKAQAMACPGLRAEELATPPRRIAHSTALHLRSPPERLSELEACTALETIGWNLRMQPHLSDSLALVGADSVWADPGVEGAGTAIAILDSGVDYTHPELGGCDALGSGADCRVVAGDDPASGDSDPMDCADHGTHVAAIAGGVAPAADLVALKVFTSDTGCETAETADIIAALDWLLVHGPSLGVVAVNLSLGSGGYALPCDTVVAFTTELQLVHELGIVPLSSAGNDGLDGEVGYPACVSEVIAVGASYDADVGSLDFGFCSDGSTAADQIACFSNSGPLVDLMAPGGAITAVDQTYYGTSQASPHVAGAVALLREAWPDLQPEDARSALRASPVELSHTPGATTYSYPRLDLPSALEAAAFARVSPLSTELRGDGDADGQLELGESGELVVELISDGTLPLSALEVELGSEHPELSLSGRVEASELAPGDRLELVAPASLAESCAEDAVAELQLESHSAEGSWSHVLELELRWEIDDDGDGYLLPEDCNDADPAIHPGASELCGGADEDCDGSVDEADALGASSWYPDEDGDGMGAGEPSQACAPPAGHVASGEDCDDADPEVYPGALERCNGRSDACGELPPEELDADGDGALDCEDTDGDGLSTAEGDCAPADPTIAPGLPEQCDGLDNNCDGELPPDERDSDGDGLAECAGDCDDGDPSDACDAGELSGCRSAPFPPLPPTLGLLLLLRARRRAPQPVCP